MSSRVREHQDHTEQSIFHHGLIKLIISTVLQKKGNTWDYFLFWSGFQSEKEDQSKKSRVNKAQNLVKKLKKEGIVKVEEDSVQERSMTRRVGIFVQGEDFKLLYTELSSKTLMYFGLLIMLYMQSIGPFYPICWFHC